MANYRYRHVRNTSRMPVCTGEIVGDKYRIEHVLGEGGMGIVVAARHLELGELYAIKVMKREALHVDAYAELRFIAEARTAARLKGQHIARVHDISRLKSGEPYMVMEHLQGIDLKRLLRARGPLSLHDAVTYVLQVCEALAEAHALGIIHRDIKPQNLFLVDGTKSIKVLDFGISKHRMPQNTEFTGSHVLLGTPYYMSPEQMEGSKYVDQRSDIWSIGVVLYEFLTGRVPFPGENVVEIAKRVFSETPRPPTQLRLGLPLEVDAVVERCLERDRAHRFAGVAELTDALHAFVAWPSNASRITLSTGERDPAPTGVMSSPVATDGTTKKLSHRTRLLKDKISRWRSILNLGGVALLALFVTSERSAKHFPPAMLLPQNTASGALVNKPIAIRPKNANPAPSLPSSLPYGAPQDPIDVLSHAARLDGKQRAAVTEDHHKKGRALVTHDRNASQQEGDISSKPVTSSSPDLHWSGSGDSLPDVPINCIDLYKDAFPFSNNVSKLVAEDRQSLIERGICRGGRHDTQLCCTNPSIEQ